MTTLQALTKVRKRIENGWTRGALARDRSGKPIYVRSPHACRWCLQGAVLAVCIENGIINREILRCLHRVIPSDLYALVDWNDRQKSKHAVLAAIDRAIEKEKKCDKST